MNLISWLPFLILIITFNTINSYIMIGIDMGSEFFKVALLDQKHYNSYKMIENLKSGTKTQTAIFLKDTERLFESAVTKLKKYPKDTFWYMESFFGEKYGSSFISTFMKEHSLFYDLEHDTDRNTYSFKVSYMNVGNWSVEAWYAMIFRHIKTITFRFVSDDITAKQDQDIFCFLTIPSSFNYIKTKALVQAVEWSQMRIRGIINENSAAALFYHRSLHFDKEDKSDTYYVFFNMGATRTQVSLIGITKTSIRIIKEISDSNLGGSNFNHNLAVHILNCLYTKATKEEVILSNTKEELYNIILPWASKHKEILSANKNTEITLQLKQMPFNKTVIRDEFNTWNHNEYKKITDLFNALFEGVDDNITLANITQIELLGEASESQDTKIVGTHLNGDDSIALGAAVALRNTTTSRNRVTLLNSGNNFDIFFFIEDTDKNVVLNKKIWFRKGSGYGIKEKINVIINKDFNVIVSDDSIGDWLQYQFTGVLQGERDIISKYYGKNTSDPEWSNLKIPSPWIEIEFTFDHIGEIQCTAKAVFSINLYLSYNASLDNAENTNETVDSVGEGTSDANKYDWKQFQYTPYYIPSLNQSEIDNILAYLNRTELNITTLERQFLNMKTKIGSVLPKQINYVLSAQSKQISDPLSLNRSSIDKYWGLLDSFDQYEHDISFIISLENELETLWYTYTKYLDKETDVLYGNENEISNAKQWWEGIKAKQENSWFKTNWTLWTTVVEELKSGFSVFEEREDIHKKRENEWEMFYVLNKKWGKKIPKLWIEKPWVEYYYEDVYLSKTKGINDWVTLMEKEQKRFQLYETPIITADDINIKYRELKNEYKIMKSIEKPRVPEKVKNVQLEDLVNDDDREMKLKITDWITWRNSTVKNK